MQEQRPVQHDREQEIGDRTRADDGDAPVNRLAVEGAFQVLGRHRSFAFVRHLDVPAQRKYRDHPLGVVGAAPLAPQGPAESHRKAQHLDVAPARNEVMPQFVDHDKAAESGDKRTDRHENIHCFGSR